MPHLGNKHACTTVTYLSFHKLLCLWNVCATDMAWFGISTLFIIFLQHYADLCLSKAIVFPRQKRDQSDLVFFSLANLTAPSERIQLEHSSKNTCGCSSTEAKAESEKGCGQLRFFLFFLIWAHNQFLVPLAHCHTSRLVPWKKRKHGSVCPPMTFIAPQISTFAVAFSLKRQGCRWK